MHGAVSWLRQAVRRQWLKVSLTIAIAVLIVARQLGLRFDLSVMLTDLITWTRRSLLLDSTTLFLVLIVLLIWSLSPMLRRIQRPVSRLRQLTGIAWLKAIVSVVAVVLFVGHLARPDIQVDAYTIGLLILAALPWLTSLIESAKLPGGWEIKFRDIQAAGDKVAGGSATVAPAEETSLPTPSFLTIAGQDPNLAIVGLRIEIENRVRALAERYNIIEQRSLMRTIQELHRREVFDNKFTSGLEELVRAGNSAAHGATVEPGAAQWAMEYGPAILAALDEKLQGA